MLSDSEAQSLISFKKIIFCLPGRTYSGRFLVNLTNLTTSLTVNKCLIYMSQNESSCIHRLRNTCGGGTALDGLLQTPFKRSNIDYDYILWIDSDVFFTNQDFINLVKVDKDIVAGWYTDESGNPSCGFFDKTYKKIKQKKTDLISNHPIYDKDNIYSFSFDDSVEEKIEPYRVDWCGMGWVLMKKGVMEKIHYPWFAPRNVRISDSHVDCLSEDISFQLNLKEAGVDIWLHPGVKVGHEKIGIL